MMGHTVFASVKYMYICMHTFSPTSWVDPKVYLLVSHRVLGKGRQQNASSWSPASYRNPPSTGRLWGFLTPVCGSVDCSFLCQFSDSFKKTLCFIFSSAFNFLVFFPWENFSGIWSTTLLFLYWHKSTGGPANLGSRLCLFVFSVSPTRTKTQSSPNREQISGWYLITVSFPVFSWNVWI